MRGVLRSSSIALAAILLCAPVASAAQLALEHVTTAVTEVGTPDGVLAPGDTIDLTETVLSSEPVALPALNGTLSASTPGVSLSRGSATFPGVAFGDTTANTVPFRATIGSGVECGQSLSFSLGLTSGADSAVLPLRVGTGAADAPVTRMAGDVPHSIPNPGVLVSSLTVTQSGRVKGIKVRIGQLSHPYVGDLRISLISPAGTRVMIFDRAGGSGDDLVSTVLGSDGAPVAGASAPFTGQFRAAGDLSRFDGEQQAGTWRLEVQDTSPADAGSLQSWGTDIRPATCTAQPIAMIAAAPNPAALGQNVTFDASESSDPTGTIVKYEWDLDGDGSFETDTAASAFASRSYASRASVPVSVRITNDNGVSDVETVTVAVTQPPTADFSVTPATPLSGQDTTLDGSTSTDPDGAIVKYEWDLDGNGSFERDTEESPFVATSWSTPGTKTVRLRVTDDNGASHVATRTVDVDNRAPNASFTAPDPATTGTAVLLDASSAADPDGEIAKYEWDLDGDGSFETDTGTTDNASRTFLAPGTVTVGLRVTDDAGATAEVVEQIQVTDRPVAAIAATPNPARPGDTVALSAAGSSDADGTISSYEWDLDGNGTYETATNAGATTSRLFASVGSYTVRVRVSDNAGATDTESVVVSVVNDVPVVQLSIAPATAEVGQTVVFSAAGTSDPDGTIAGYAWDLDGNGSYETLTGSTPSASRSYPNATSLQVAVRVTDDDGGQATKTGTVVVTPVLSAPPTTEPGDGGGGIPTVPGGMPGTQTPGGTTPAPSTPGATAPGGGTVGDPGRTGQTRFTAWLTGTPMQKAKAVAKNGLQLACRAEQAAVCTVVLTVTPRDAKRMKLAKGKIRRPVVVGSATVYAPVGKGVVVAVKLKSKARKAITRQRQILVTASGVARLATGESIVLSRAVLVRK